MSEIIIYPLVILVVFNIYVNIRLIISPLFERFQKIAQSLIIWVIPLLGALLVLYLVSDSDRDPPPPTKNPNYGNDSMPGGVQ